MYKFQITTRYWILVVRKLNQMRPLWFIEHCSTKLHSYMFIAFYYIFKLVFTHHYWWNTISELQFCD